MQILENIQRDIGILQAEMKTLHAELLDIRIKQEKLMAQANRWSGGLFVILSLGGFAGWILKMLVDLKFLR